MTILAVGPGAAGIAAITSVITGFVIGLFGAVDRRRRTTDVHFTRTVKGFEDLLSAQESRIDELESEVESLRADLRVARSESYRANQHAFDCERELRAAKERIARLEEAV